MRSRNEIILALLLSINLFVWTVYGACRIRRFLRTMPSVERTIRMGVQRG